MDPTRAEAKTPTLLLVEDNRDDADLVRASLAALTSTRFQVIEAVTIAAALAILDRQRVDVVLLDLSLPDGQGLATVERIVGSTWRVPIVVMTGHDDEELAVRAVQAGAHEYLVKGTADGRMVGRTLRHAMERQRLVADAEDALELRAQRVTRDQATGLPSRIILHDRLYLAVARGERFGGIFGFALIDLEQLLRGGGRSDRVYDEPALIDAVRRMDAVVRKSDTLSRFTESQLGFIIERVENRSVAEMVARRVLAASAPIGPIPPSQISWDVCYGLALYPDDGHDGQSLLRSAEAELRRREKADQERRSGGSWSAS